MKWTPAHTLLLVMSVLGIYWFWSSRRDEDGSDDPYNLAIRKFRIAMLIGGIGGIIGLVRWWFKYKHGGS